MVFNRVKKMVRSHFQYLVLLLFSSTPLFWFIGKGNAIINGLDTNFPLDPLIWFGRRFFVWNDTINAGIDSSTSTSGWFFHLVQVVPYSIGFNLQITQIISLLFWFGAIVLSSYYCSQVLFKNRVARLLFVSIFSFNIYIFNTWENVKVANLALMVGLPLFLGLAYKIANREIKLFSYATLLVFSSIISSGVGINPAYFASLYIAILTFFVIFAIYSREFKRTIGLIVVTLLVGLLINSYWMIPFARYMFVSSNAKNLEDIGFNNWVSSLSENTSILNVMRLQGAWDWYALDQAGFPLYIPYALNYFYNLPFIVFSFILPLFAVLAFIFIDKKQKLTYSVAGMFAIIGVFLGAGVHPPTGSLYGLLLKVPYFSFFRSPWYIFTPYLIFAYATLTALLFNSLHGKLNKFKFKNLSLRYLLIIPVFVYFVGNVIYLYPIFTGKIFRPGREDSFFINFPSYVFDTKEWLESSDLNSRIATYPDDDLEKFKWGYRGTESILSLSSNQEIIAPSFVFVNSGMKSILSKFYNHLKLEQFDSAISTIRFLGVGMIQVRKDASTNAPDIKISSLNPTEIGQWEFYDISGNVDESEQTDSFGVANSPFLEKAKSAEIKSDLVNVDKIFAPNLLISNKADNEVMASLMGAINLNIAVVDFGDSEIKKIKNYSELDSYLNVAKKVNYLNSPTSNTQIYELDVLKDGEHSIYIEKNGFKAEDIYVNYDNRNLSDQVIIETDSFLIIKNISLQKGLNKIEVIYPELNDFISDSPVLDKYRINTLRPEENLDDEEAILFYDEMNDKANKISIPIDGFSPFYNYHIKFDYKYYYGFVPIIDIFQFNESSPLRVDPLTANLNNDWTEVSHIFKPAPILSRLEVQIRIPDEGRTSKSRTHFRNFSIKRVYDNDVLFVRKADNSIVNTPDIRFEKINPVKYRVSVNNISESYILAFLENYSSDWRITGENIGRPGHFRINGYANAWYIPGNSASQELTIYYYPQKMYVMGVIISVSTFITLFGVSILFRFRKQTH